MKFGYYPGCALHGSSFDYERSVRGCFDALGIELSELDDWICCGASAAHSLNAQLAVALPARNLAIAERDGIEELLAPCPMCSVELMKAREKLATDESLRRKIGEIVELGVTGKTRVINLIEVLQRYGVENIVARQTVRLEKFKPACYYGCLLTRPPKTVRFDDCERPSSMETFLSALGAAPVEWNLEAECCGGGLTLCDADTVIELTHRILSNAASHGANCLVVACPMCQMNLDMRQADVEKRFDQRFAMPVYYLSDLVGLAVGKTTSELAIDRHFVRGAI